MDNLIAERTCAGRVYVIARARHATYVHLTSETPSQTSSETRPETYLSRDLFVMTTVNVGLAPCIV